MDINSMVKPAKKGLRKSTILFVFFANSFCWEKQNGLIYILEWTPFYREPFVYLGMGQYAFIIRNCTFQNCFLTNDRSYFDNLLDFDAIVFNVFFYVQGIVTIPEKRSETQQYILAGVEPASYFPVFPEFDGLFNITWTYKLSSDVVYPYIYVKNMDGEIIGPKKHMHWINKNNMDTTKPEIIDILQSKSIAAAWIVSNCYTTTERGPFVNELQKELSLYGHRVDIYGDCGTLTCSREAGMKECYDKIERDYYFYLAFENSFSDDYVTEKILHGLNHYAVPVVLGGANYTRFMPEEIYLDAGKLGVKNLAKEMNDIINNPARYIDFFRWHRYYTFHNANEDNYKTSVCEFCALLNNETRRNQRVFYRNITKWWNEWGHIHPTTVVKEVVKDDSAGVFDIFNKVYEYFFTDK